ncbi:MAG TPA: hypothetical protein VNS63_23640 [Blastocatellia bacterium]|nr:hypothetical protein [Blastocatellia bacterium]
MQEASNDQSAVTQPDRIPWGWVIGTAIGLEVALIISAVVWVAIYSYVIHPGEAAAYYENYAQFASPFVSVVAGIPFWFFACRWLGEKAGTRAVGAGLLAWFILFIIDMSLIIIAKPTVFVWTMVAISHSTKLLAAYLGARAALKRHLRVLVEAQS